MNTVIEVNNVSKSFGKNTSLNQVLNGACLNVQKGEFVSLMGASGSGKSTLLYSVSGMDKATSGTVTLSGKEITNLSDKEMAAVRLDHMGFIFQQMYMMKNLTVLDNIILPAVQSKKLGETRAETEARGEELMKKLGLVRYSIAVDSGIVTKVYVPELILVLRGEPIISIQSFDLHRNNVSVVAYVMPDQMKHINRNTTAEVFVTDDVSFNASVLMLGTRTEEIPGELRSSLSRDHTAVIVVLGVDTGQVIPFWTLVKNIPVRIRVNNFESEMQENEVSDYMMFHTTHGLIRSEDDPQPMLPILAPDSLLMDSLLQDSTQSVQSSDHPKTE